MFVADRCWSVGRGRAQALRRCSGSGVIRVFQGEPLSCLSLGELELKSVSSSQSLCQAGCSRGSDDTFLPQETSPSRELTKHASRRSSDKCIACFLRHMVSTVDDMVWVCDPESCCVQALYLNGTCKYLIHGNLTGRRVKVPVSALKGSPACSLTRHAGRWLVCEMERSTHEPLSGSE